MLSLTILFWSIALLITASGVVTGLYRYLTSKYRHVLYASLGLASQMAYLLFALLAQVFIDTAFFYIAIYANMPMGLCAILLVDSMSGDHTDLKKVTVYLAFIIVVFTFSLEPGVIYLDYSQAGGPTIQLSDKFLVAFYLYTVAMNLLYLLYNTKIHVNAPQNLKKYTRVYFGSTLLYSIVTPVISAGFFTQLASNAYLVPSICYVIGATGGSITVIILSMQPKLAFILPFKVERLTVFETTSGIMLYNYAWRSKSSMINDELFSSILQGFGLIIDEAIKKGPLEELVVTKAHIILKRSIAHPVAFVIVASHTSKSLRTALDNFAAMFVDKFDAELGQTREVAQFKTADSLVDSCFPFIPEYR
jgi:hypothetical protein